MLSLAIKNSSESMTINPSKIICLGLNYLDHIEESVSQNVKGIEKTIPKEPVLFNKTPNVITGHECDIIIPAIIDNYTFYNVRTDYEAELAIVIGKKCKNISKEQANDYIFGYTCMNDVSQRNLQMSEKGGWFRGKSFDTFGPIGPVIVKKEDIGDPQNLNISCRLNGKTVQSSNTGYMIFKIPEIVSFISKNFTLNQGDIIMTGTPSGVGPLKEGDVVEIDIENIGILKNKVTKEVLI